jgi:hypothetical protein
MGNQDPHWNMKVQFRLLERCRFVLVHAGSIVEVAKELVENRHVQQVLGLKEYWGKLWYV